MQSSDDLRLPYPVVVLLPDAPSADGEPRAAVLRPGLPPLAFATVREALAQANAWGARP